MLISFYLISQSGNPTSTTPLSLQFDLVDALFVLIFSSFIEVAFLFAPFYFAYVTTRRPLLERRHPLLDALGLRRFPLFSSLGLIVLLFLVFLLINGVYQSIIIFFHLNLQTNDQVILQQGRRAPLATYATLLVSVLVAPICEEIFFRGFVFMGLLRAMPVWAAVLVSALLFAVAHVDVGSFAVLFFIGIALAFVRWRTRSLWPSVLLHLLNNATGTALILIALLGTHS